MAAVGQMFYTAEAGWFPVRGNRVSPLTLTEALTRGGLDWEVGSVDEVTPGHSVLFGALTKTIVRLDRRLDDPRRVLGIVSQNFVPVQNRAAASAVDAVFGNGKNVYHTGGYLGKGETVWLLARIGRPLRVGSDDVVLPYALMVNGHDGHNPLTIGLTSVRVVCENTLRMAMRSSFGPLFRYDPHATRLSCADAARQFFAGLMHDLEIWEESFVELSCRTCPDAVFRAIVERLFPDPEPPLAAETDPLSHALWRRQLTTARAARMKIEELRETGKGMSLPGSRGTFWGALNAVTEYVDHHAPATDPGSMYTLLGAGMDLKVQAFELMHRAALRCERNPWAFEDIPAYLLQNRASA